MLRERIPAIVAAALNVLENKDARLTPEDIEVWIRTGHPDDVNTKDLEVVIHTQWYAERQANLENRERVIRQAIGQILESHSTSLSGFVWVLLSNTAFGVL